MDFVTAEERFQELQARIRRGEPLSEEEYQEELAKLMVQDDSGLFWSLEPGTGRWLYFNGTEWVPGTPPKPTPPPAPPMPPAPEPTAPPQAQPTYYASPMQEPYGRSVEAQGERPSYATAPSDYAPPRAEQETMPPYVRVPEPEPAPIATSGGIPPRPVRDSSPLSVPVGERAWLPFAFGAIVLLLCAVVLFFGVRGLPFLSGTASQPTEIPTEEVVEVLPSPTVELEPTQPPEPTEAPTPEPTPSPEPQIVTATTTEVLNIRQGPSRTMALLGKLPKGTTVTVVGRNDDNSWLQIQIPEKSELGWVSAEFVTINGDVNTLPVVQTNPGGSQPKPTETPAG